MKTVDKLFTRLRQIMPAHIKPRFATGEQLLRWNLEEGEQRSQMIARENRAMKMQRVMGRSGISELYLNCSFNNYQVNNEGQRRALLAARNYAFGFDNSIASFIFSGNSGTGKNHLAAAIGSHLILNGKHVLVVTVYDLMSKMKGTFSEHSELTQEQFLRYLSTVDLLIIDEIGMQSESRYEKLIINQLIDRRSSSKRPTGMLTNLNHAEMTKLLGERVMDRMRFGESLWVTFDWDSYRKQVRGDEY